MDKLKMHSADKVAEHIAQIGALFPNCLTEVKDADGAVRRAIDFDMLRQELSGAVVDGPVERYQFTWPDKRKSVLAANAPITKTLRPCRAESVNFDTTENLYIEGDNLDVLKLLQETYFGTVKMIYIDPPYNTGNDLVYEDDFAESAEEYMERGSDYDEEGNQLFRNTDFNGRFHTDWLNMLYPRLKIARDFLSTDGVIFISIDDNEVDNLKKICSEIFGVRNFVGIISWFKKSSPSNDAQYFSNDIEYILVYAKEKALWHPNRLSLNERQMQYYQNPDNDPRGPWNSATYTCNKTKDQRPNLYYPIKNPFTGKDVWPKETAVWAYSREQCAEHQKNNLLFWGVDGLATYPRFKKLLSEHHGVVTRTLWHYDDVNHTQGATEELKRLNVKGFSTPKPSRLIAKMLRIACESDSIIMDFFSGSATTAHAVMQLNSEDGGQRKFIMVQLPEPTDEKSEAYKAGYKNICEIGKERIRRAGKKIRDESPLTTQNLDTGFRVLKVDSSNMKDVYYSPAATKQADLFELVDNIKPDRTGEDLLFQVMLELGISLSSKIEQINIGGKTVYSVADGYLLACFDSGITSEIVTEIAKHRDILGNETTFFVMRDSSLGDDETATNFEQIFQTYSPSTVRKVL